MTELSAPFAPDWVIPPGASILDLAEEKGWTQSELARRIGFSEKHISQLINGKVPVTTDTASRLEKVLGSSVEFWLTLEANYQKHKARLDSMERCASWVDWLKELPIKDLMSYGAISKRRLTQAVKPDVVSDCLRFFGVASPDEWRAHYGGMQVSFRRSRDEQCDVGAISAWLRLGEEQAERHEGPKYDRAKFESALHEIRSLTREQPEVFEPQMRGLLHNAGVIFVLVPSIPRAYVSGVARWLGPSRPVIQMSLYGKSNDKFWFTFFHEAAHILLHASTLEEKKSIFLDDPNAARSTEAYEHEANTWAANWLIPELEAQALHSLRSKAAVITFASRIGVHPGIVVGRLQHEGIIEQAWFNDLKSRFRLK